jgi:hypothetical protein
MNVYLDNAATTTVAPEVVEAMVPVLQECFGNPSSSHAVGRKSRVLIEQSRRRVAKHLNCHPSCIYFTSGGTEADNLALRGAVRDLGCTRIITSEAEHSAVIKTAQSLERSAGTTLDLVRHLPNGKVDLEHLAALLAKGGKTIVSLMHANNEVAVIQDLERIGTLCREAGALFHSDTVQTMCHYTFDLEALPVDFITCSAHKFHGPKGVGFLYVRKGVKLKGQIEGGSQERAVRGGTESTHNIGPRGCHGSGDSRRTVQWRLGQSRWPVHRVKRVVPAPSQIGHGAVPAGLGGGSLFGWKRVFKRCDAGITRAARARISRSETGEFAVFVWSVQHGRGGGLRHRRHPPGLRVRQATEFFPFGFRLQGFFSSRSSG